jgi:hypothetical protein
MLMNGDPDPWLKEELTLSFTETYDDLECFKLDPSELIYSTEDGVFVTSIHSSVITFTREAFLEEYEFCRCYISIFRKENVSWEFHSNWFVQQRSKGDIFFNLDYEKYKNDPDTIIRKEFELLCERLYEFDICCNTNVILVWDEEDPNISEFSENDLD